MVNSFEAISSLLASVAEDEQKLPVDPLVGHILTAEKDPSRMRIRVGGSCTVCVGMVTILRATRGRAAIRTILMSMICHVDFAGFCNYNPTVLPSAWSLLEESAGSIA